MVLINVIAFVVWNLLYNIVFKSLCLQITADTSKISKKAQGNIIYVFNGLSDTVDDFV